MGFFPGLPGFPRTVGEAELQLQWIHLARELFLAGVFYVRVLLGVRGCLSKLSDPWGRGRNDVPRLPGLPSPKSMAGLFSTG